MLCLNWQAVWEALWPQEHPSPLVRWYCKAVWQALGPQGHYSPHSLLILAICLTGIMTTRASFIPCSVDIGKLFKRHYDHKDILHIMLFRYCQPVREILWPQGRPSHYVLLILVSCLTGIMTPRASFTLCSVNIGKLFEKHFDHQGFLHPILCWHFRALLHVMTMTEPRKNRHITSFFTFIIMFVCLFVCFFVLVIFVWFYAISTILGYLMPFPFLWI